MHAVDTAKSGSVIILVGSDIGTGNTYLTIKNKELTMSALIGRVG